MAKWGEIKCPRCDELEAKVKELEEKISEMFDAAQQVHRDGGRELARLATEAYSHD
jgi:phage FluMu protein Com